MISDAKTYKDNQGMKRTLGNTVHQLVPMLRWGNFEEKVSRLNAKNKAAQQNETWKRKQERILDLLTSLNRLSANLFAAISVAERQIAVLQDLHSVFSAGCRTKTKDHQKEYPLGRNPFYKNIAPIPILSENSEQIWPNTLETVDEVVRERKYFIKKIKELVGNMDIRRKMV